MAINYEKKTNGKETAVAQWRSAFAKLDNYIAEREKLRAKRAVERKNKKNKK